MSASSDTLLLGTRKGLLLFRRESAGWKPFRRAHLGNPIAYAMRDRRTGTLWCSIDHGHWGQKLNRSDDLGETWREVPAPRYPEGAEIKEGKPATLRYVWVMAAGGTDQPQRFYLGTEPGGLFRSDDGGETFELVAGLWNHPTRPEKWFGGGRDEPGIHSILVDPRDSRRLQVGISCAGVFESPNDGEIWFPKNRGLTADFLPDPDVEVGHDPHFVAACPADPEVLWQQNHCGIFRSTDGGGQWHKISDPAAPAHFGFAIAADAQDPLTAWVVPADSDGIRTAVDGKLCVCRTEDGGKSWTAFRQGLPQEDAYDITFRHALDVSGDTVAFGTTTGNVFVSEDRGETWTCLGNHLPPVYSVRFA